MPEVLGVLFVCFPPASVLVNRQLQNIQTVEWAYRELTEHTQSYMSTRLDGKTCDFVG